MNGYDYQGLEACTTKAQEARTDQIEEAAKSLADALAIPLAAAVEQISQALQILADTFNKTAKDTAEAMAAAFRIAYMQCTRQGLGRYRHNVKRVSRTCKVRYTLYIIRLVVRYPTGFS